jgi:hypothetical protein
VRLAGDRDRIECPRRPAARRRDHLERARAHGELLLGLRIDHRAERDERVGAVGERVHLARSEHDQRVLEQREQAVLVAAPERLVDLGDEPARILLGLLLVDRGLLRPGHLRRAATATAGATAGGDRDDQRA